MDQYGEELYQGHVQGPIEQEMQAPPSQPRVFYAAKTMPNISFDDYQDYEERVAPAHDMDPSSSSSQQQSSPLVSAEAAQVLLSGKLDDLTEKLAFIKNNIIQIGPQPQQQERNQDEDEFDRTTLHTLHHDEVEER